MSATRLLESFGTHYFVMFISFDVFFNLRSDFIDMGLRFKLNLVRDELVWSACAMDVAPVSPI